MQFDGCVTNGFINTQPGMARRAVHQIDGGLAVLDARVFIAAREIEFQAGNRLIPRFQFGASHGGVEIVVDRRAVHDLGNLIAL